ncbi:MAG TPA: sodium:solute symporter [Planctomycetota bacterium]|nr:sodium:solute symporter [Planctomycetota bacterium]
MGDGLSTADWCVVGIYLGIVAIIGFYASGKQKSTKDYFLGGKSLPWWAAALSIIATETSAVTYIGVPRMAYQGDWAFAQLVIGFVLGRIFLALFFVQVFYRHDFVTVYGFLEQRFGGATRTVAAILFLLGRVVASAVRLYAGCVALKVATGFGIDRAIIALGAFGTIYTLTGGIRAVIWTDVLLGLTFMAGGIVSCVYLASAVPGGLEGLIRNPLFIEKTTVIHLGWSLSSPETLLAGIAGGFVLTLATHGTDQDIAQRMLTCRDAKGGSLSVLGSAVLILPLMGLFLLVGTLLFFFYQTRDVPYALPANLDHIFPLFIVKELPLGFRGLVMAGLLAVSIASFTSVLNALASTTIGDFYSPARKRLGAEPSDRHMVRASRVVTLFWGAALVGLAMAFEGSSENLLTIALQVLTYFYGALLGAFLLGIFTRRGSSLSVITGMVLSVPAVLLLQLRHYVADPATAPQAIRTLLGADSLRPFLDLVERHVPVVAWPYWIIIGTAITFLVGILGTRGIIAR